jgi:hypothetical protein
MKIDTLGSSSLKSIPVSLRLRRGTLFVDNQNPAVLVREAEEAVPGRLTPLSNFFFRTAGVLPILFEGFGHRLYVAARQSSCMRDKPLICALQQGIRPELEVVPKQRIS